ncbi:hypothetical protein TNCV_3247671, partial [Trichonephila clavipes]
DEEKNGRIKYCVIHFSFGSHAPLPAPCGCDGTLVLTLVSERGDLEPVSESWCRNCSASSRANVLLKKVALLIRCLADVSVKCKS